MKSKKILASLVACSLLVVSLVGCNSTNQAKDTNNKNNVEEKAKNEGNINELGSYLGETYQQLIQEKGQGSDHVEDVEGKKVIVSSTYSIRMFNYNADLVFELDDSKNISSISIHFKGITPEDILSNIKSILGNPTDVTDKKDSESKVYQWKAEKYQFKLDEVGAETIISINKSAI